MTDTLSLADLMKITGERRRSIQHWTDVGILKPEPGTTGHGPGVHRAYNSGEAVYALIAGELNRRKLPVSEILSITEALRATKRAARIAKEGPLSIGLAEQVYHDLLLRWALYGRYPVLLVVNRQPNGVAKMLMHAVGAAHVQLVIGGIRLSQSWFATPLERKVLDDRFDLTAADLIRLDRVLAPARHLFAKVE